MEARLKVTNLWVNSVGVDDATIVFNDTDACGSSTGQVTACVQANITETLNDECFTTPAGCGADCAHIVGFIDEVLQAMENTAAGSRDTSMDTAWCYHQQQKQQQNTKRKKKTIET